MLSAKKELFTPSGGGYQISRSVRLRSSASAYFNRTPATTTNRKTFTYSLWVKRGILSSSGTYELMNCGTKTVSQVISQFNITGDKLSFETSTYGVTNFIVGTTAAVFRDPSAWYHIVFSIDTTQATNSNGVKIYVNGVQQTLTFSAYTQNYDTAINTNAIHDIGQNRIGTDYFDGYLTEVNFIDGQALTPSSFGETNALTGVWQPKRYTGTYGTNGFYLNFSDNSAATAATIGKDYSGNGNNWTPNNISITAGATYDSMLDVPTLYADGDNGRGNYAVLNPLFRNSSLITEGNLHFNKPSIGWATSQATMSLPASKTYFEATAVLVGGANSGVYIGIATASATQDTYQVANQWSFGGSGGVLNLYNQTTLISPAGSSAAGDILQVAYDGATGNLWFGKNNTWYNSTGGTTGNPSTGANPTITLTPGTEVFPCAICYANALKFTFGQRPFTYTPPTGFKALNTQNLPDATIKKGNLFFNTATWSSDIVNPTIGQKSIALGFQPDLVWSKNRDNAESHYWMDSVRGDNAGNKWLRSNATAAEGADALGSTTASYVFNSTGFDIVDTNSASGEVYFNNGSASTPRTYVGWAWNAGGTSTNITVGQYGTSPNVPSIASTVRANPTAGFSVVTWTSTGANATIGHGLGVAPKMVIVKGRSAVSQWFTWHTGLTSGAYALILNLTDAQASYPTVFNSTTPTSSVFSVGTSLTASTTAVAYCFAEVAGYSAFGRYTGNGSVDGPFVYLGFRPRFVIIKRIDTGNNWHSYNSSSDPSNVVTKTIYPNLANAEATENDLDFVSNGMKMRDTGTHTNASGGTYIYMAWAENPFQNSLAR